MAATSENASYDDWCGSCGVGSRRNSRATRTKSACRPFPLSDPNGSIAQRYLKILRPGRPENRSYLLARPPWMAVAIEAIACTRSCEVAKLSASSSAPATSPLRASSRAKVEVPTDGSRPSSLVPCGGLPGSHRACCAMTEHSSASTARSTSAELELKFRNISADIDLWERLCPSGTWRLSAPWPSWSAKPRGAKPSKSASSPAFLCQSAREFKALHFSSPG